MCDKCVNCCDVQPIFPSDMMGNPFVWTIKFRNGKLVRFRMGQRPKEVFETQRYGVIEIDINEEPPIYA